MASRELDELIRKAARPAEPVEKPKRSIMELHGLGKEIWKNIDAQEYVNELRKEWDHHNRGRTRS